MASNIPATTKGFSYLLDPEYRKIFYDEYVTIPEEYTRVLNIGSQDKGDRISEAMISGLGSAREVQEGHSISFDSPEQGYPKTVYFTKYGLGFQITEEMQEDDLTSIMRKMPAELGKALAYCRETTGWDLYNRAATVHKCSDGQYIFSTAHPLLKAAGTTWSNLASSGGSLTETTLESSLETIDGWVNEAGRPVRYVPRLLVVPTASRWIAKILLKTEKRTDTADNDINPVGDEGLDYMVGHYLTSTTRWFIVCTQHDMRFVWRRKARFQSGDDFATGNALFKGTMRCAVACWNARGVYSNAGA